MVAWRGMNAVLAHGRIEETRIKETARPDGPVGGEGGMAVFSVSFARVYPSGASVSLCCDT